MQKFTPAGVGRVFAYVTRPTGLAFDANGDLYVSNLSNTIQRYNASGTFLRIFASLGCLTRKAWYLYVANSATDSVEKYSPGGTHLGAVAQNIGNPLGLTFDSS